MIAERVDTSLHTAIVLLGVSSRPNYSVILELNLGIKEYLVDPGLRIHNHRIELANTF